MSIFSKLRDSLYNIVEREGNFGLQFFADLIRGSHTKQSAKHIQGDKSDNLNYEERQVFQQILERRGNEGQIEYWKRKKGLLNHEDKKSVVQEEISLRREKLKNKENQNQIEIEKAKRIQEKQMQNLKHTKRGIRRR